VTALPTPAVSVRTRRILVVDDDALVRFVHLGFLRSVERHAGGDRSFECEEAPSVRAAIRAIDREPPDLILLDHALGDGFGIEVLRHVRGEGLKSRVVVVSGTDDPESRERAERLGVDAWIRKPMTLRQLVEVVSPLFD
jgi:CheY-like chemotaxis protein